MNIIIGAGISGLSAGHILNDDCVILEKSEKPGGLAGKYVANGFAFDYGGHYFHFQNKPAIKEYVERFHSFRAYQRNSKIYLLKRFIPYSLQYHLAYLPAKLRRIILQELAVQDESGSDNLKDYLVANFGLSLYRLFFEPFLAKFYRRPLSEILAGMDKGSIPLPRLEDIRRGAIVKKNFAEGYNPIFYYPRKTRQNFIENYSRPVLAKIHLKENVVRIEWQKKKLHTTQAFYEYDHLISTMPLKELLTLLDPLPPFQSQKLQHISTLVANVVLAHRRRHFHWLYLPESAVPFYRVGYYPGTKTIAAYLEKTVPAASRIDSRGTYQDIIYTLRHTGMIEKTDEVVFYDLKKIPVSYIVFDQNWPQLVPPALAFLRQKQIFSIGRYGSWNYTSMADDIQTAWETAMRIRQ